MKPVALSDLTSWLGGALPDGPVGLTILEIRGSVLLIAALLASLALRRSSAAMQHLVWSTALVGFLMIPILGLVVPEWRLPAIPAVSIPMVERVQPEEAVPDATSAVTRMRTDGVSPLPHEAVAGADRAPETVSHPRQKRSSASGFSPHRPREASQTNAFGQALRRTLEAVDWGTWLLLSWLMGVALALSWMAAGYLNTWRTSRLARRVEGGSAFSLLCELSEELCLTSRVVLLEGEPQAMPRTWGLRPKVLLPSSAGKWPRARLRAVLLHELAHVRRHDYLVQLVASVARAIHWFNPLVWYAVRKMRIEGERACDDHVLNGGSRASDYAEHLLEIAISMKPCPPLSTNPIAFARRSHLRERLLDVLDISRRRSTVSRRSAAKVRAVAALLVIPVAGAASPEPTPDPAPALEPTPVVESTPVAAPQEVIDPVWQCDWNRPDGDISTSVWTMEDDSWEIRLTKDNCSLRVEASGDVRFNDQETDILSISRGGLFEIEEREGRSRWRLEVEPASGGSLDRRWFVNGEAQAYDAQVREWFARLVPVIFRRAGFQAEERASRILAESGVDGVLRELSLIPGDWVARQYYAVLLTDAELSNGQLRDIVRQAGRDLESDYELAELLIAVAEEHPVDEAVQAAYVEAAGTIESDYETRRVLDAVLDRPGLSQEVVGAMLRLATEIKSDYELAELLIGMLERHPVEETFTTEFFSVVRTLESDYEHRRVLDHALERGAPSQQILDLTIESASDLESDYELAELLVRVCELYPTEEALPASFLRGAGLLDSDYERSRVLGVLIERDDLSAASLEQILSLAGDFESDYERSSLLVSIAEKHRLSDRLRDLYLDAAEGISSSYERDRALAALVRRR